MPKFYFDLHECGTVTSDPEGAEANHISHARELALHGARDIMCEEIKMGALCLSCFIEIRDENRKPVHRIMFKDAVAITGI